MIRSSRLMQPILGLLAIAIAIAMTSSCTDELRQNTCGKAPRYWLTADNEKPELRPVIAVYVSRAGSIYWNKKPVGKNELSTLLKGNLDSEPMSLIALSHDRGTSCLIVNDVRRRIDEDSDCLENGLCKYLSVSKI